MDPEVVEAALEDWRDPRIPEKLSAALGFLEKLTLRPEEVGAADIAGLKEAGLDRTAIEEAVYVCFLFNVLDRLADALDFELPSDTGNARIGLLANWLGYDIVKLPG